MKIDQNQPPLNPQDQTKVWKKPAKTWHLPVLGLLLSMLALQADDSFSTAIAIEPGDTAGAIDSPGEVDYFQFTIPSAQMVTVATKASAVQVSASALYVGLYDASNTTSTIGSYVFYNAQNLTNILQPGTYYVRITSSRTGGYRLVLKTQSSAIPLTEVTEGNLDVSNDWENYKFTVVKPGYVLLRSRRPRISTPTFNLTMTVRDEAGNFLGSQSGTDAGFGAVLNPGNYFVTITSGLSGDFNLKLTTPDTATPIVDGITPGQIEVPRDHNFYQFVIPGNDPRAISFTTSGNAKLGFRIRNEFGQSVFYDGIESQNHSHEVTLDPGIYFLMLFGTDESGVGSYGNYTLTLAGIAPSPPPVPEISIQQPARSELVDGKSKRSFGTAVAASRRGITKTFVIRNNGSTPLTGIKVSKGGRQAADFEIKTPPASSLATGKQTTFKVTFLPKAKGRKNAWLRIASNDTDENPFDISITGLAVGK